MELEACAQVAEWLRSVGHAVAFTGAGISTESGIPDFRSPQGVWATSQPVYYDEFVSSAEKRKEYWRQKSLCHRDFAGSRPNQGHQVLAKWEREGRLQAVITQNIDGLHQDAGSRRVLELHGTARFVACLSCEARFDADPLVQQFLADECVPNCPECGGLLKHATVSFGQLLPEEVVNEAYEEARASDLLLAMGSSLVVTPAAHIPALARQTGARLVLINRDPTPLDVMADVIIRDTIGPTLAAIDRLLPSK